MAALATEFYDVRGRSEMPFQLILGPRGCGKSYTGMDYVRELHIDTGEKFLYLRRTREEVESIASDFGNPYKTLNLDKGYHVQASSLKSVSGVGVFTEEVQIDGATTTEILGYAVGLSSFASLRSVDLSDVSTIIFDEAIPESHKRLIKNEGIALLNLYETVNRNRELKGMKPVRLIIMGNSIRLNNPILSTLGVISVIQNMIEVGEKRRTIPERGLYIELVDGVSIIGEKRSTALYRLGCEAFNDEALSSQFVNDDMSSVNTSVNMKGYKPYLAFGDYGIYYNPSEDIYHVADVKGTFKSKLKATEGARFRMAFAPKYRMLRAMGLITFKSYPTMLFLDELLGYDTN